MTQTTVTIKGQVTIPKEVRDGLGLANGDKVAFVFDGDRAVMFPLKGDVFSLRGVLKKHNKGGSFDAKELREKAREHVVQRYVSRSRSKR